MTSPADPPERGAGSDAQAQLAPILAALRGFGLPKYPALRLWNFLWSVISRRHGNRLPQKVKSLKTSVAGDPWGTVHSLGQWIDRREPGFAAKVASSLYGVDRLHPDEPDLEGFVTRTLDRALQHLEPRGWGRGRVKSGRDDMDVGVCYEMIYEELPKLKERAMTEGWESPLRSFYELGFGVFRSPSAHIIEHCRGWAKGEKLELDLAAERVTIRLSTRSELAIAITADCFDLSKNTVKDWKNRKDLSWLPRHRRPKNTSSG